MGLPNNVIAIGTPLQKSTQLLEECAAMLRADGDEIHRLRTVSRELLLAVRLAGTWAGRHDQKVKALLGSIADNAERRL